MGLIFNGGWNVGGEGKGLTRGGGASDKSSGAD